MADNKQVILSDQKFSQPLRAALWGSPVLIIEAYLAQWLWRFPPLSVGASLTAKALACGALLASISALCAGYRLVKTRASRTVETHGVAPLMANRLTLWFGVRTGI
jgi:hypothetical protein